MIFKASIIIPAFNEAKGIDRLLRALTHRSPAGKRFEILVVCNGCTDDTAETARAFSGVRVFEIDVPSKSRALNVGDMEASGFPRIYLDADVLIDHANLEFLICAIEHGGALAYSACPEYDTSCSSYAVRRFYAFWLRTPYFSEEAHIGGTGMYALTEVGRSRFSFFPDVMSDDGFVNFLFDCREKKVVKGCKIQVSAPLTLKNLLKITARAYAGRMQLLRTKRFSTVRSNSSLELIGLALRSSTNLLDSVIYFAVQVCARTWALWMLRGSKPPKWHRDTSTRI